ncbi:MAG: FtsW/RodA/SpoVE family cell cycle protein [Ruminococcaceae bacterium]|nr:FtsW/RodA/SpoVE family cell cycle protein [Oscillospiraceae bacterium]
MRQGEERRQKTLDAKPVLKAVPGKKKKRRFLGGQIDIPLLTIVILLLLFGLVMLFSASYPNAQARQDDSYAFISNQVQFAVLGLVGMVAAAFVDYRLWKRFAWPLMVVALVMLVVVLGFTDQNGAHRWIWIGPLSIQPSEVAKLAVILVFAKMISANQSKIRSFKYGFFPFMLILGVVAVLMFMEPHLSGTILILGVGAVMMVTGGTPLRWLIAVAIIAIGAAWLLMTQFQDILPAYALKRIATWQDPFGVPAKDGHQVIQSLIAVGSGGLGGQGIGNSVQKYMYLPEVYNDYIFAVVCEELGLIGAVALILLFLALLARGILLALRAKDKFGSMLVIGITVQIALQALLHVAVNINAIPSTGISLPFFSSGGSSLCMLLGEIGIVLSVSRHARQTMLRREEEAPAAEPAAEPLPERAVESG